MRQGHLLPILVEFSMNHEALLTRVERIAQRFAVPFRAYERTNDAALRQKRKKERNATFNRSLARTRHCFLEIKEKPMRIAISKKKGFRRRKLRERDPTDPWAGNSANLRHGRS